MAFLDDLMTFEGKINEGIELDQDLFTPAPKSWLHKLGNKIKSVKSEIEYRRHTTVAGFPLVLPHRKDGQLYAEDIPSGAFMLANWYQNNHRIVLPSGFYLEANGQHMGEEGATLQCQVRKFFDDAPKTDYDFALGDGITITYLVTPQGMIGRTEISYRFDWGRDVSFSVYREDHGKVLAELSAKIRSEIEYDSDGILSVRNIDAILALKSNLNYGRTLRNLSKILKTETFTDKDFASLFNLQYQCVLLPVTDSPVPGRGFIN